MHRSRWKAASTWPSGPCTMLSRMPPPRQEHREAQQRPHSQHLHHVLAALQPQRSRKHHSEMVRLQVDRNWQPRWNPLRLPLQHSRQPDLPAQPPSTPPPDGPLP